MAGCSDPCEQCLKLAIAQKHGKVYQCTLPSFVPKGYARGGGCPSRIHDWRPSQVPQRSREAKTPGVKEGDSCKILSWTHKTLERLCDDKDTNIRHVARVYFYDLDMATDMPSLERLGKKMVDRLEAEKPWER